MGTDSWITALECQNVVKKFRRGKGLKRRILRALDGATLSLRAGELFGLLGPNGAGKTTLVRCIATLLIPDEGTIRLFGHDVFKDTLFCRQQIGLLTSGERTLYWKLSARDNLKFFAALYGLSGKERDRRIDYLLELLGLKEVANERLERYSSGMKQKVSLARAMLHDPRLLLLDEPTLGLDPQFGRFIRQFIKEELNQKQGKTILLTTHYMDEADELCERIAFINRGKIVDIKSPEEFKRDIPHKEVLAVRCQGEVDISRLKALPGVERLSADSRDGVTTVKILAPRAEQILSDVIELVRTGAKILTIDVQEPTLEDVFIYMTGTSLAADTTEE
ncbi:MAG: ABC transporter ATP-binding protein [candidate division WOR-3 bacterium]|jgi:ABC-2 type transport system ATP-binding protein|nr:ABC transporter ATP-binding protein [candidate division WOR-3 bacterium]MCR4424017.1 ABC transporter ATP-binding protein [candidate division WOR-3 bacterium]MDH7519564.1 ABC transporter ATP-binding protein [bacterium]